MLQLKKIHKYYTGKDIAVHALKGIDLTFRDCEFVSILGPSGCGKTTLLNVVGGLDHYDKGDLIINGVSTKKYRDHDWDIYRNHTIGFVFQSYNLIPHLSVLQNVELSLTLSGESKQTRKQKAIDALEKVGLKDQIHKKPNQLSGGQMQRVAIARAIVNNPKIILADEPTGALDTQTSIQVMNILKDIAKECLVIMVTHNPDLANQYSTRIIKLLDGVITDDSNPITEEEAKLLDNEVATVPTKKQKKVGMKFGTSLGLSLRNLMTKKGRTILTAFAGSIGIIGIALILSISAGFKQYISNIEEETLSSYPLTITNTTTDLSAFTEIYAAKDEEKDREEGYIYSNEVLSTILTSAMNTVQKNDLAPFKEYIDENRDEIEDYITDIKYVYDLDLNIYNGDYADEDKASPQILNPFSFSSSLPAMMQSYFKPFETMINSMEPWQEMLDNQEFLENQYDLVDGKWPTAYNEVVIIVNENNELYDYFLYALGIKDPNEILSIITAQMKGEEYEPEEVKISFEDILDLKYRVLPSSEYYKNVDGHYEKSNDNAFIKEQLINKGFDINVVGIIKPNANAAAGSMTGCVGYTRALSDYVINYINESDVVKAQKANENVNILTGEAFGTNKALELESVYSQLGVVDLKTPTSINIYPSSFDGKDKVIEFIDKYNSTKQNKDDQIKYTDVVGVLMSSISIIIDAITYVLIAFVSISLIVSSIMIAIVTHISVIERTKEIGVLRSIGASKQDVRNVFNAETLFIGFISGLLGVGVTVLLCIPINLILESLADLHNLAKLPLAGGIILVLISTFLTIIAGLIPANKAAKLDPVNALRSE